MSTNNISPIIKALNEKYDSPTILPNVQYVNKVSLTFDEAFPAYSRNKIKSNLDMMHVRENYPETSIRPLVAVTVSQREDGRFLFDCVRYGNNQNVLNSGKVVLCRNNFGDAETDAAWLVYMLTQDSVRLNEDTVFADINVFSMMQQKAASAIKGAAYYHFQTTAKAEGKWDIAGQIIKYANKYTKTFTEKAPVFSGRPVSAEAWRIVESSMSGLIHKAQKVDAGFERQLYGSDFRSEMEEYVAFASSTEEYRKYLDLAADELSQMVKTFPFLSYRNAIKDTREKLNSWYDSQKHKVGKLYFSEGTYRKLDVDTLTEMFSDQTEAYRVYAQLTIAGAFSLEICDRMLKIYEDDYVSVLDSLNDCLDGVNGICDLSADTSAGIFPWNAFVNIPEKLLSAGSIDIDSYTNSFIERHNSVNGNVVKFWVTGHTNTGSDRVHIQPAMNEDILVSYAETWG